MSHYYEKEQDSELVIHEYAARLRDNELKLESASGIFSAKELDKGASVLIEHCEMKDGWAVLDLGCGNGVVGIALKKAFPGIALTMSDVNERAVMITRRNSKRLRTDAKVVCSDKFEKIPDRFDTILFNPPQSAGKDVCFAMISQAKEHLNDKGLLQVVARHNKGGRMLSEYMETVYGNVRDIARKGGYRVYVSTAQASVPAP
jgi:16S rRNA (guanine1207-N2)-methyltransferase